MNLVSVPVTGDGQVKFGSHVLPVDRAALASAGKEVMVGVRPEDVEVTTNDDGMPLTVELVEELGADAYVHAVPKDSAMKMYGEEEGVSKPFVARVDGRRVPQKGETIYVYPNADHVHVFNAESGQRLG